MSQEKQEELSGSHAGGFLEESTEADKYIDDITRASDKSKGARPYFFSNSETERVLNITMAIATEVAVLRERIDTIERLLEKKGLLTKKEVEDFIPTDEEATERQLWHARYTARILRIVQQEMDAVLNPENNLPMRQIADEINEM